MDRRHFGRTPESKTDTAVSVFLYPALENLGVVHRGKELLILVRGRDIMRIRGGAFVSFCKPCCGELDA